MPRIEQLIGDCEISHHYLWEGPAPQDPDTILDMFLLSDRWIFHYEITTGYTSEAFWGINHITSVILLEQSDSPESYTLTLERLAGPVIRLNGRGEDLDKLRWFRRGVLDHISGTAS